MNNCWLKYVALLFLPCFSFGQRPLSFQPLGVEDGLSQGHVNAILRSSDGFIWIGTQDGLNRYDGYGFRHFHHHSGDTASLSNNYVWCLLEDADDFLWIGTFGGGLSRFDRKKMSFRTFHPTPLSEKTVAENSIRSLCEFPRGTLWVGTDRGLWLFDLRTATFTSASGMDKLRGLENVTAIYPLAEGQLLVGAGSALLRYSISGGQLDTIAYQGKNIPAVSSITRQSGNTYWAGGSQGLYQLQYWPGEDSLAAIGQYQTEHGLAGDAVSDLHLEDNDILWIATSTGLSRLTTRNIRAGFTNYHGRGNSPNTLSSNIIACLAEIEPGLIWAGSRKGISRFSTLPPPFFYLRTAENGQGLCTNGVLGMAEDNKSNLWVATRGGLTRISGLEAQPENWEQECLHPANTPSMPFDYVINLAHNEAGELWVMFRRNGLARLRERPDGGWYFVRPQGLSSLLGKSGINDILKDKQGIYWLATPGRGLIRWDALSGNTRIFLSSDGSPKPLSHDYIFCLLEDSRKNLWVGTANGGLCRMNRAEGDFDCYVHNPEDSTSLSSNMVLSLFEDSRRRLWVCTARGLNLMEKQGQFRRFLKKDGLPNEVVYGLLEDERGNFWASTNRGIAKITFHNGRFSCQNFDQRDGLQGNEFNQYAFYKTHDGRFCFGGANGLTIFRPEDIQPYPHPPQLAFTGFQLFNQPVRVAAAGTAGRGSIFLASAINETEEIVLRHDQNFIAFEFAALGYRQPENNQYAYKMEGLGQDWVFSGGRRFASYPNLAPGGYTFMAKAANHDGVWNEQARSIRIRVLPPWWRSWWAYLVYGLVAVGLVAGIIRQREASVRRIEQAKAEERERFRKRTARDFHDEAGNKITKIALLTEVAKRQAGHPAALPPLLAQIEDNIQGLRAGMRDFIWVLDPANDNLYDTLLRLKDFGNGLFEHSSIHFYTEGLEESLSQNHLNGNERRQLLLIFKEAMHNCVKHSESSEAVLSVKQEGEKLLIALRDNGRGFDPGTATGNGLNNMRERARAMGAEWLFRSSAERGTSVAVQLTQMGY